jgi:hypothetical protein
MDEDPGLSDQYRRASPWPVFVALGLVLSEVGVFLGLFTVAVFGLLLFGGSIAGILTESGYTTRPWPTLLGFGAVLAVVGLGIVLWQIPLAEVTLQNFGQDGVLSRSVAVVAAGAILAAAGSVASVVERAAV